MSQWGEALALHFDDSALAFTRSANVVHAPAGKSQQRAVWVLAVAHGYGWAGGAYLAEDQQAVVQSRLRTVAVREIVTADPVADLLPRLNACSDGRALVFADG